ncbi:MAG: sugar kinase [Candidatus Omnitrophica bacterium]|nr:sugar kinase [Candidatus Omnitrophota bacterium]
MSLAIIGSVAFDTVETLYGKKNNVLGGSATYAALGASFFSPVNLISVVGTDFPRKYYEIFRGRGVNTLGVERKDGETFRWEAKYHKDLIHRDTLSVKLNVFEGFKPVIPIELRKARSLFLANIDPELQGWIFKNVSATGIVACDTMDHWIATKKKELLKLLGKIDILLLNDEEARQLSGESNLLDAARYIISKGAKKVVIKKGEHGALLFSGGLSFMVPVYLVKKVVDPTGAGDTFGGGMLGYLAGKRRITDRDLRRSLVYGSILASFTVEDFSVNALLKVKDRDIRQRYKALMSLVRF